MGHQYAEFRPPAALAGTVECLWSMNSCGASQPFSILPDGCADLVYLQEGGQSRLVFAGPMTIFVKSAMPHFACGLRYRPGRWTNAVHEIAPRLRDRIVAFDLLREKLARDLHRKLDDASHTACPRLLLEAASAPVLPSPVEHSIQLLERWRGSLSIEEAARSSGLSLRQFRRRCEQVTGFSPKLLARILRFRHADELIRRNSKQLRSATDSRSAPKSAEVPLSSGGAESRPALALEEPAQNGGSVKRATPGAMEFVADMVARGYSPGRNLRASISHAEIAVAAGYADQSHMIADFRVFSGQTPYERERAMKLSQE